MELKTEKVRPAAGATVEKTVELLLNQFALLIDEIGHELGKISRYQAELRELASRIKELEQSVANLQATQST